MSVLVTAIHVLLRPNKSWMAGTSLNKSGHDVEDVDQYDDF